MSIEQVDVDILAELKAFSDQNLIDIYLPSQKKSVKFRKLNVKQQKSLILVALDDVKSLLNFNITLYDIIYENLVDDKNLELNIYDRNSIVFNLIKHDAPADKIDLYSEIVERYNKLTTSIEDKVVDNSVIQITLGVPTLERDYIYNKKLLTKYNSTVENTKEFIDNTYLLEIAKYIKKIEINKGGKQKISKILHEEKLDSIFKIVDSLPSVNQIIGYMSKIKQLEKQFNTVKDVTVDISPSLFI